MRQPSPKMSTSNWDGLVENPEFRKFVHQQTKLQIKQALRDGRPRRTARFTPRMDVVDDDSFPRIIATFELPGVRTTDLTVQVTDDFHDNTLLVSGQRKLYLQRTPGVQACLASKSPSSRRVSPTIADSAVSCHRVKLACELQYGSFSRAIRLPPGIKNYHINTRFEHGLLIVSWPRTAPSGSEPVPHDDTLLDDINSPGAHEDSMVRSSGVVKVEC